MSPGPINDPNFGYARERFDEIEASAEARNEEALLEHRDELPRRPSVVRRTLDVLRSALTGREDA